MIIPRLFDSAIRRSARIARPASIASEIPALAAQIVSCSDSDAAILYARFVIRVSLSISTSAPSDQDWIRERILRLRANVLMFSMN